MIKFLTVSFFRPANLPFFGSSSTHAGPGASTSFSTTQSKLFHTSQGNCLTNVGSFTEISQVKTAILSFQPRTNTLLEKTTFLHVLAASYRYKEHGFRQYVQILDEIKCTPMVSSSVASYYYAKTLSPYFIFNQKLD